MKDIIDFINEAMGDHRINMKGSIKHDACPGCVMKGENHRKVFKKGDIVYINTEDADEITGTPLKDKNFRPAKIVGIRVLKATTGDFPGSKYLIDYSYDDEDNRNIYTKNAKDIWNEIHIK